MCEDILNNTLGRPLICYILLRFVRKLQLASVDYVLVRLMPHNLHTCNFPMLGQQNNMNKGTPQIVHLSRYQKSIGKI